MDARRRFVCSNGHFVHLGNGDPGADDPPSSGRLSASSLMRFSITRRRAQLERLLPSEFKSSSLSS